PLPKMSLFRSQSVLSAFEGISWSYKFGTASRRKKHAALVITSLPHMELGEWLQRLDLAEYGDKFRSFNGVEELLFLSESDIKKLGIRNNAHRARIVSSLVALREKLVQGRSSLIKCVYRPHKCRLPYCPFFAGQKGSIKGIILPGRQVWGESLSVNFTQKPFHDGGEVHVQFRSVCHGGWGQSVVCTDNKMTNNIGVVFGGAKCSLQETTPDGGNEAVALKKALEWELSLDSRDLRSHAWYHGPIPRQRAEEIVQKEGDFLVRDCVSQPGNYVLTCRTKGPTLHFVINKLLLQPETVYERVQYQFEDDAYDTVPDLITFYVGSGKSISVASGARIQFPCNRTYPLSFYAGKCPQNAAGMAGIRGPSPLNSPSPVPSSPGFRYNPYTQQTSSYRSPMSSPPRTKRETPPRLPSKKQRSQSLTPLHGAAGGQQRYSSADGVIGGNGGASDGGSKSSKPSRLAETPEKCNSADGVIHNSESGAGARPSEEKCSSADGVVKSQTLTRPCSTEPNGLASLKGSQSSLPRSASLRGTHGGRGGMTSYHPSGSDSGNGSGDSAQSSATGEELAPPVARGVGGVVLRNPRFIPTSLSSITLRSHAEIDPVAAEEALLAMQIPTYEQVSRYDLENFNTLLLPFCDCKPLDSGTLNTVRMMLCESGPRVIANHLTRVDIGLILEKDESRKDDPLSCTGLELITLEQGKQYRLDLIERTECMKLLVAVTILTCQSDLERAETLNKWIQIAVETKTALGNLFGFSAIMLGLSMPQIQKLESTWHTLRQKFTDSAFNFEAKLRPTLNSMNDCSNPQAPNTTIPHILPYVLVKDRTINDVFANTPSPCPTLIASCVTPWETITQDFGFSVLFAHLDAARSFINNISLYKKNAQTIMQDTSRLDPLMEDAFKTEFQMKFLWGSKGALVPAEERHAKFEHVLTVMAEKFCGDPSAG
ncbi:AGAP009560-PA, partial [Anopheles gambiae str. PEST]